MGSSRWDRRFVVAAAALALGLVVGCGGSNGDDEADQNSDSTEPAKVEIADEFAIAVSYDVVALDPASGESVGDAILFGNVLETLVEPVFEPGEVAPPEVGPSLAVSWEQTDDTTWEFKLREGVKFTNGEPFDAEAVKFTIERFLDPATQAGHASFLHVNQVNVIDPQTVELVTDGPSPDLLRALFAVLIVPPKAVQEDVDAYTREPIGTGPYKIADTTPDVITLEENPDYWDDDHVTRFAHSVSVLSRPEAATRVAAVQAGEVDVAENIPIESVEQVPAVKSVPSNENLQVILNATEFGAFQDAKLREAAIIGVDRDEIRASLFGDEHSRSANCQHAAPAVFGFNPSVEAPPYDPERAKQLVEESGYDGGEIRLLGAAGRYPKGDEMLQAIAAQWEDIGLEVNLQIVPTDAWIASLFGEEQGGRTLHKGHDAIIVGQSSFSLSAIEPLLTAVDTGAQLETFPHEQNPEVQTLLDKAKGTVDPDAQRAILEELGEKICAADSHLFVANSDAIWGVQDESSPFVARPDLRALLFATDDEGGSG